MKKEDNSWQFNATDSQREEVDPVMYIVDINDKDYVVSQDTAALTHAILLLVNAINDKKL